MRASLLHCWGCAIQMAAHRLPSAVQAVALLLEAERTRAVLPMTNFER